jgi:hypothetical protein
MECPDHGSRRRVQGGAAGSQASARAGAGAGHQHAEEQAAFLGLWVRAQGVRTDGRGRRACSRVARGLLRDRAVDSRGATAAV